MDGLYLRHVVVAAVCSVLVTVTPGSPVVGPEPIRCAPCTPERLGQCPAVAPGCAEVLREPGCGCCLACALKAGELCGIYTSPCGSGLRCTPRPDDPRPLHALTRGQAVCTESPGPQPTPEPQTQAPDFTSDTFIRFPPPDQGEPEAEMDNAAINSDPGIRYPPGVSKPYDPRVAADAQESMKAKVIAMRRKLVEQGPCHLELQVALDKIAKSQQKQGDKLTRFYLPNCDKHGLYKPKQVGTFSQIGRECDGDGFVTRVSTKESPQGSQSSDTTCESSLDGQKGRCWCVISWNGKKVLGSTNLPADAECP
ncbi:unnamed protein product [Menidia menidia]|uniref:Insulin-like growth factor-binding protein 1 n=1 Tax=Menidia menidia TaxID=238744 RepID=A0A8S4A8S6_9TELE|nr:unnamed protein product [Menidia menidia]